MDSQATTNYTYIPSLTYVTDISSQKADNMGIRKTPALKETEELSEAHPKKKHLLWLRFGLGSGLAGARKGSSVCDSVPS